MKKAVDIALALESADKNAKVLQSTCTSASPTIHSFSSMRSKNKATCSCHKCGKAGHIAPVCCSQVVNKTADTSKGVTGGGKHKYQYGPKCQSC